MFRILRQDLIYPRDGHSPVRGNLFVETDRIKKLAPIKFDGDGKTYVTVDRKRYYVKNTGTRRYAANFVPAGMDA